MQDIIEPGSSAPASPQPTLVNVGRGALCREALASLPEWFGRPASVDAYVIAAETLPMLACFASDGALAGFLSLKIQTDAATEIDVMGVKPAWHRRGVGRALVEAAAAQTSSRGAGFLTVKTLAPSHPDRNYEMTRRFYQAIGFLPIEVLPTFWSADIPCLLMARPLVTPPKAQTSQVVTK